MSEAEKPEVVDPVDEALAKTDERQNAEALAEREPTVALMEESGVVAGRGTYLDAIEFGKIAAMSGLYPEARTAARAAMVAAMGLALGVDPPVALSAIHILEKDGKVTFVIEGKLLAALVERRPNIAYKIITRTDEEVEIEFLRDGEPVGPNITWTDADVARANLAGKFNHKSYPRVMKTWRALAEGVRLYFPEVLAGQTIYVEGEVPEERAALSEALEGPRGPMPLDDDRAEELRKEAGDVFAELRELNPKRLLQGRFQSMLQRSAHSHAELENTVKTLLDLVAAETVYQDAIAVLIEKVGEKAAAEFVSRAERRGSSPERLEVITRAIEAADEPDADEPEGGPDDDVPKTDD